MGQPFSITLVFPDLDDPEFPKALELAQRSPGFLRTDGPRGRYRAPFLARDVDRLLDVFQVVGRSTDLEILVDDQSVPYGRELWIPLVSLFANP